jgi:predicted DNA-binding protein
MDRTAEGFEMKEEHREKLRELAERRGGERLSDLVAEAIEHYLAEEEGQVHLTPAEIESGERTVSDDARRAALALRGSLTESEADELEASTAALRRSWRGPH